MEKNIENFYETFNIDDLKKDSPWEPDLGCFLGPYLPLEHVPTISNIDSKYAKKEIDEEIWKRYSVLL